MTGNGEPAASGQQIGSWHGLQLSIAAWDAVTADVDLACACMFQREVDGADLAGGLLHLDRSLGLALTMLRAERSFKPELMETLHIARPGRAIKARELLIVGLGDPDQWTPPQMRRATRVAVHEAVRLKARTASFAPSMLDAGLHPNATTGAASEMLGGVVEAWSAEMRLVSLNLAPPPVLESWTFGAGAAHVSSMAAQFERAFTTHRSTPS
jgi:hypothetical protein